MKVSVLTVLNLVFALHGQLYLSFPDETVCYWTYIYVAELLGMFHGGTDAYIHANIK